MASAPTNPERPFSRRTALQVSLVYGAFTSAWIFFSDRLLVALVGDPGSLVRLSSIKGLLFAGVTAVLLFILLERRPAARLEEQSLSRLYATISAANQAIVRSRSLEEVFRAICRACVDHGGFRMAWVGLADPDTQRILVTEACGSGTEYLDGILIRTGADAPEGRGPTGIAYREERVQVCNDFSTDPGTAPWREKAARYGFGASIALPLRRGGKTIGTLNAYAGRKHFFDDEAVSLLKELADNISFAIDHFDREALRQQAEAALRLSEGRLREAQAVGRIGDWEIDIETGHTTWSPQVFRLFERDPAHGAPDAEELLAYHFPESADLSRVAARRVIDTGERIELEQRVRLPSGRTAYHASVMMPGKDAGGRVTKLYGTVQDITGRKRTEERLRRLAEEVEDLYQHAPCGYHSVDADGILCRINETELQWLRYSRDEVIGKLNLGDLLTPASRRSFDDGMPRFKESGVMRDMEYEMIRKDGTILPVLVSATAVFDAGGRFVMSRSTVYDMSERRKMEEERAEHARRLGELSRRLVAVQEQERRLLSAELHDRTSPNLAAIRINLGIIAAELPPGIFERLGSRLEDTHALLEDATASVREICADLRPPILDHAGLLPALEGYALQFADRTGIAVRVGADPQMRLAADVESLLFRIVQEALTNCAKHAGADAIAVELRQVGPHAVLTISDDGVGFDPGMLERSGRVPGLGLLTMRERAEFAGGKFSIESNPGRGTRIRVEIQGAGMRQTTKAMEPE